MADAVMYFIRHGEGQLQSTWGRLAKQASKAPASMRTAVVSLSLRIILGTSLWLMAYGLWHGDIVIEMIVMDLIFSRGRRGADVSSWRDAQAH